MDKWMVRYNESDGWWHVCDVDSQHSTGIFSTKIEAVDYCEELNRKELGKAVKSWPNV